MQDKDNVITKVCHQMIRNYVKDSFDPFFVYSISKKDEKIESVSTYCFYYSFEFRNKYTIFFDNLGVGGCCSVEDLSAIWKTEDILDSFSLSLEEIFDLDNFNEVNMKNFPEPIFEVFPNKFMESP